MHTRQNLFELILTDQYRSVYLKFKAKSRRDEKSDATGTIGHVAHGKSSTVRAISGVQTVRFKNELERNITIKLGYANAKVSPCHAILILPAPS